MKLASDLHIHSCLSPCGDALMTPNNLVNMAYVKGLDVIALSDHNSARNLPAAKTVADARGLLLLPAIELETREEVHMLCYMPSVEAALSLGDAIYPHIPDNPNMPEFFGEQLAMNEDDEVIYTESKLLIQSTDLSLDEAHSLCLSFGGVPVPAHINRTSNSLLSALGFIPPSPHFSAMEVYRGLPLPESVDLSPYHVLYSSDAHDLEAILERDNFLCVEEKSVEAILKHIGSCK